MLTVAELQDKLLTVDEVREKLQPTEGLQMQPFTQDGSDKVEFSLPEGWNESLAEQDHLWVTDATIKVAGTEVALTKEAILEATSFVGLTKDFVTRSPGPLVEPLVNYWYNNGTRSMNLVHSENTGLAFTRGAVTLASNVVLMDEALNQINHKYGKDVLCDYKFHHSLRRTHVRLIVPEQQRHIASARAAEAGDDPWSLGLAISNSVIGEKPLSVQGYMFAWWCTNGATTTHSASATRRRKVGEDTQAAYDWMALQVDQILEELEHEFDVLETLPSLALEGDMAEVAQGVFEKYHVPVDAREAILKNLADSADLTAYGMMNAITAAANDLDLNPFQIADLLSIGGQMPHALAEMCGTCHRL